ncbi:MAG: helix-turn-helix transcriptional regulator [Sulfuritalea sp.]|nr:helix-turn-helix transcriptional regulator [Sulfuritalea sp.]MDP1982931.1 helix-turn-helix transcriptional regulator [Sulfuritalea sp.]
MFSNEDTLHAIATLGARLRTARIDKGDSQALFAKRLGVSVPTLRDMETGSLTVSVGAWAAALWMLSRLSDLDPVLQKQESLFERAARAPKPRQRASKGKSTLPAGRGTG